MNPVTTAVGPVSPMGEPRLIDVDSLSLPRSGGHRVLLWAVAVLAVLVGCGAWSAAVHAAPALNFSSFSAAALNADGTPATQAGGHPWELLTSFEFGTVFDERVEGQVPGASLKDSTFELPPGVLGDPSAVPRCAQHDIDIPLSNCPIDSQVGYAVLDVNFILGRQPFLSPIYNMVPPPGEPAQFAFVVVAAVSHIDLGVRGGDHGVTATVRNANASSPVYGATIHLWGVPADSSHDPWRFGHRVFTPSEFPVQLPRKPLLRNPTSCAGPLSTAVHADSWQQPGEEASAVAEAPAVTGCSHVPFAPTASVMPDTRMAGSPAGFDIGLEVPQNTNPDGLASSDLKGVVMRLPEGVAINPSSAGGLAACSDSDFAVSSTDLDGCPDASKIGSVEVKTPLIQDPLHGSVFLASPLEQGPAAAAAGRMFRLFLELEGSGVRVKLAGSVVPDPVTGQLTATFDDNPQLPFESLHIQLNGGSRAPLSTPTACGVYTTHTELTPWARPTEPVSSDSSFTISEGCGNAGGFTPSLEAGSVNPVAGGFAPFTLRVVSVDGQQNLSRIEATLPEGVIAKLAGVGVCGAVQAATGDCPASSQIGTTTVGAGAGASPVYVPQPGLPPTAVYLGGPYKGAPYSLVVKVPAQAGPFDLGTVTVQNALFIDRTTAQVTVKSDPLPQILDGVPVSYRDVRVLVDRAGFTLNPTSCDAMAVSSTLVSAAGLTASPSSRFQVGECARLKFAPKLSASTSGKTSRAGGASLHVKLTAPAQGPQSNPAVTEANIAQVKVDLPKALPSRLTTLQKACTAAQFALNPAGCPAASLVGHAKAVTPILSDPLEGPAYFVSHGGDAFPSLIVVLQGDGVTVDLVGSTFISKAGITSSTFKQVPDVPIKTFELTLPQGKYSALAANGSLCSQTLTMPTAFTAQNDVQLKQSTRIAVTGCPKAKKSLTRAQKLSRALKACQKTKAKSKRGRCEQLAHKKYGAKKK